MARRTTRRECFTGTVKFCCGLGAVIALSPVLCLICSGIGIKRLYFWGKNYKSWKRWKMKGRQRDENVVRRRNPRELHLRREGENLTIGRSREVRDEIRDGCEIEIAEDRMKEEGEAVVEIEVAQDGTKEEGEVVIEIKLLESVLEVGDRGYTSRQEQSPFFKLPFEIRRQIYQDILGGYVIHIRFLEAYRKMAHSRCNIRHPKTCTRDWCRKNYKQEGASDPWKVKGLLDMLLSCRMIYSEAIEVLYTANTFDFESLSQVLRFSITVLPERMKLIRDVQWKTPHSMLSKRMPWLDCRAPNPCSCIECWPRDHHRIRSFFLNYER